ncbi:MAG: RnfABCDGE type electron transport complex subunit B [Betaproteobacteria bacterium]|nr:RnfABCDGE type electron transport complex subunit B [Betaproteobacteria bacterium]
MIATAVEIDALLPQTQCTRCGYDGCMPYAHAMVSGEAAINRCPPGGDATIAALAALLGRPALPLDPDCGVHTPHRVAVIDADACIGCAKCLAPCPTDAILGANKHLHRVVAELCTGCELCIPPCPVDCITMIEDPAHPAMMDKNLARDRFDAHNARFAQRHAEREALLADRERAVLGGT